MFHHPSRQSDRLPGSAQANLLSPQSASIQIAYATIAMSDAKRFDFVNLNRIILGFVQPFLALLLMTGTAQAEPCLFDDNDRARIIERTLDTASILTDDVFQADQIASDEAEEGHGFGYAVLPIWTGIVLDQARLIENGRASYPTAPPSHRPCAAPPTGPPLV